MKRIIFFICIFMLSIFAVNAADNFLKPLKVTWVEEGFLFDTYHHQTWIDTDGDGIWDYYIHYKYDIDPIFGGKYLSGYEEGFLHFYPTSGINTNLIIPEVTTANGFNRYGCENNLDYDFQISCENNDAYIYKNCDSEILYVEKEDGISYSSIKTQKSATKVWPMPAKSIINVEIEVTLENLEINIYTYDGSLYMSKVAFVRNNNNISVDISNFQEGFYNMHISSLNDSYIISFIKE